MSPEEKLELLRMLIEHGVEVWTRYRQRRVVAVGKATNSNHVIIQYEDGSSDKITMQHFATRRFVVVL